jgi:4-amino-4-deoxy-L-arabinose transferase-like glycosyltransferase
VDSITPTADLEAAPASKNSKWTYVFFLGVGVIAIALRTPELSSKGFWLDEAYSVLVARLPLMEMLEKLSQDATPPLYYILLAPWVQLFGTGEAAARALSIVFSVGGIALMGLLSFRYFSPRIASVVTLMLAFTPMSVYYAQEARMYSLLALLGTALVFSSLEYLTRRSRLALILVAFFSLLMLLTHNVAAWFVIGVNIAFLSLCNDRKLLLHWLAAQSIAALCYLPWLLIALEHVHEQSDVLAWFFDYWNAKSVVGHFMTTIGTFALGDFPPYLAIQSPLSTAPFLRGGALLLMFFGLYRWRRSTGSRFIAVTLLAALILSLGYSALYQPVHIPGRTDHAYLPLFALLLALGIDGLKSRLLEGTVLLIGMIGALAILQLYHDFPAKNDSRTYLWELQDNLNPGDIVITTGLTWAETAYYFDRWAVPATVLPFPKTVEDHPGYLNYRELMKNPMQLYSDADDLIRISKETLGPDNAIYLLYLRPLNVNGIIAERLLRDFPNVIEIGSQPFRQSVLGHRVRIIRMQAEQPGAGSQP